MGRHGATRRIRPLKLRGLLPLAAALLFFAPAWVANTRADEIKTLGEFGQWGAYFYIEQAAKVCYNASRPIQQEGDYTRRGEAFILVTHRPAASTRDVVSIQAGYPFQEGSEATLTVDGGKAFHLFTEGDMAWTKDKKTDQALVVAMKKGGRMVVVGVSSRGTKTTDTYSLAGFTASHRASSLACGLK
ncbi:MAG: invasion associated locus B family protein [Pseudomonadota bacterium]